MILSFFPRLALIGLASFFLIHLALGLMVSLFTPAAIRRAERMRASAAARFLLWVRGLAPAGALLVTICIIGSYAWVESGEPAEEVGSAFLTAAALGLVVFAIPVWRALRGAAGVRKYLRQCQRLGRETRLPGDRVPVLVVETEHSFLALAGLLRPRLVVSSSVLETLSPAELGVAVRHERGHRLAQDNLKRLLLLLAPDIFPFYRSYRALEHGWALLAEWAADDRAVAGSPSRSVLLAGALVRIARHGKLTRMEALVTPLFANVQELSERVNRLLGDGRPPEPRGRIPLLAIGVLVALAVGLATLAIRPPTLQSVHKVLEEFHEAAP